MKTGKLYGVGIGPGDPQYLTLRAADVLRSVDVVFTVISPNASNSVSQSVVDYLQPRGEVRLQVFSMSRDKTIREEQARAKQAAAEEILSLPTLNLKTNDAGLTDDQIAILRTLKDGALQVDDLIEKTQIPTRRVLSALTMMELEGYVEQGSGKHFSLTVTLLEE